MLSRSHQMSANDPVVELDTKARAIPDLNRPSSTRLGRTSRRRPTRTRPTEFEQTEVLQHGAHTERWPRSKPGRFGLCGATAIAVRAATTVAMRVSSSSPPQCLTSGMITLTARLAGERRESRHAEEHLASGHRLPNPAADGERLVGLLGATGSSCHVELLRLEAAGDASASAHVGRSCGSRAITSTCGLDRISRIAAMLVDAGCPRPLRSWPPATRAAGTRRTAPPSRRESRRARPPSRRRRRPAGVRGLSRG